MKDYQQESIEFHRQHQGKLDIEPVAEIADREMLSTIYTPGVAGPCLEIARDPSLAKTLTIKGRTVAVITDGTAVLGLGDIGPLASIPVMEGKAALFKAFAGLNAFPIAIDTKDTEEFIATVKRIAPVFGGINLEDIAAPRCFEIERRLSESLDIPVFHDDQHGTAIVVLAGLINACKVTDRDPASSRVVFSGAGAAGISVARLLHAYGFKNITMTDSKGIIGPERADLDEVKKELLSWTNARKQSGSLADAIRDADIFVGVSKGGVLSAGMVRTMAKDAIVFAMANPVPEIMPDEALAAGAGVVASGRSDFPNQVNNLLAFPGVFKGLFKSGAARVTEKMKLAAAEALAAAVKGPSRACIIPDALDRAIADIVAEAVASAS